MKLLKKSYKIPANSILESVIALSIISTCIFITLIIYSFILAPKKSIKKYIIRNRSNEYFHLMRTNPDSVLRNIDENWTIEQHKKQHQYFIKYSDSDGIFLENSFYLYTDEAE